jgi:hypothetical protein
MSYNQKIWNVTPKMNEWYVKGIFLCQCPQWDIFRCPIPSWFSRMQLVARKMHYRSPLGFEFGALKDQQNEV